MTTLDELFLPARLVEALAAGHVRTQVHPELPLAILNYTERAAYDDAWTPVTLTCRGLIYDISTKEVVARPFPKFFNYGQPGAPDLDLDAAAVVTDKLDGWLGILYAAAEWTATGWAVATRGSFMSDQALHATEVWNERYPEFVPDPGVTYLFEIVYPANRVVVDYEDLDDLILLGGVEVSSGSHVDAKAMSWPGPSVTTTEHLSLAEALSAPPRANTEGLVVYLPETGERLKVKQDDYVTLHRIVTGTNARDIWEVAAARECGPLIVDRHHWGTYLKMDPARAEQVLALGDDWLVDVPDEFYAWVAETINDVTAGATRAYIEAVGVSERAREIPVRQDRYPFVSSNVPPELVTSVMRHACSETEEASRQADREIKLASWLMQRLEPSTPMTRVRSEDVA